MYKACCYCRTYADEIGEDGRAYCLSCLGRFREGPPPDPKRERIPIFFRLPPEGLE
jgi:hypothetical protein